MRLPLCLLCALLGTSASALAQDAPPAAPAPEPAAPNPTPTLTPDEALSDPNGIRRQALFDLAFNALVDNNLPLAERAFSEAAALPGDPAESAVAESFAERVRHLRARRRAELETQRRPAAPRTVRDPGRTERIALLGTTTALGLGLYGWTLPAMLGVDANESTRAFVGLYMLTASASFIVPYLLLRDAPVTPGQANLAVYGGTRGIWQGVLIGALFAGELGPNRRSRGWEASMILGSIAGMVAGYQVAKAADFTAGEARTIAAMGDFGLLLGFGGGFLLRFDSGQQICHPEFSDPNCFQPDPQVDSHSRKMSAMGLLGTGLGLTGGYFLARNRENTWGDGEVLRATIALGIWSAAGLDDVAKTSFDFTNRAFTGTLMLGGALGVFVGDRLVRDTNFTPGQSMLVDLSMISGGLLGAGTTYLLTSGDGAKPYVMASALGALAGFALSYWGFRDSPESATARRLSRLSPGGVALIPTVSPLGDRGLALAGRF